MNERDTPKLDVDVRYPRIIVTAEYHGEHYPLFDGEATGLAIDGNRITFVTSKPPA